jgi:predicted AAA+ superfamily ATPase
VSENTIRSWVSALSSLYYGFLVRPWFRSVAKALRKEPKWFLRDWSVSRGFWSKPDTETAAFHRRLPGFRSKSTARTPSR